MATWAELAADVIVLTKRPDLVVETNLHLRQAVRIAHRAGKFWRDLARVTVSALPLTQVQEIDLVSVAPRFRQVKIITSATNEALKYCPVDMDDLLDADGHLRTNVYWGFGSKLLLRAAAAESSVVLTYYAYPVVFPELSFSSWIADEHRDLISTLAAASLLGSIGEQEIKSRLDSLSALMLADLVQDNLEVEGR